MWQLYHHPLCAFSRKVRLALTEKHVPFELVEERLWEQRDAFLDLNPAGQTPVLVMPNDNLTFSDSSAIIEYLEEGIDAPPLLGAHLLERAEARRLIGWFDQKFFGEVGSDLLRERMWKRLITRQPPETSALRNALRVMDQHLDYLDFLLDHRRWLAGDTLTLADFTAAAHLSVADYLGGIDWRGHDQARQWYSAIKSRPSFRPLLADRVSGLAPPTHYDKLDF